MKQPESSEWMPVFMVLPVKSEVTVTAGEVTDVDRIETKRGQAYWQRIGTARTHKDGSILVRLNAVPINGRLVIRHPQAGEVYDPTV
jgi:hypothetical protein